MYDLEFTNILALARRKFNVVKVPHRLCCVYLSTFLFHCVYKNASFRGLRSSVQVHDEISKHLISEGIAPCGVLQIAFFPSIPCTFDLQ